MGGSIIPVLFLRFETRGKGGLAWAAGMTIPSISFQRFGAMEVSLLQSVVSAYIPLLVLRVSACLLVLN